MATGVSTANNFHSSIETKDNVSVGEFPFQEIFNVKSDNNATLRLNGPVLLV